MKVLAIETTTRVGSVAICAAGRILSEMELAGEMNHSEKLLPGLEKLLGRENLTYRDLDSVAASIGPGSFTGLRIGLTVARIIAQNLGLKVVGVPTLDCLAAQVPAATGLICPLIAGVQKQVYYALYDKSPKGKLRKLTEYNLEPVAELIKSVKKRRPTIIFTGEGLSLHKQEIVSALGEKALFTAPGVWRPQAGSIGLLSGCYRPQKWPRLLPLYIRPSEAELNWGRRRGH